MRTVPLMLLHTTAISMLLRTAAYYRRLLILQFSTGGLKSATPPSPGPALPGCPPSVAYTGTSSS